MAQQPHQRDGRRAGRLGAGAGEGCGREEDERGRGEEVQAADPRQVRRGGQPLLLDRPALGRRHPRPGVDPRRAGPGAGGLAQHDHPGDAVRRVPDVRASARGGNGVDALRIGLIGDHDARATAHRAIPLALARASAVTGVPVEGRWLPTAELGRYPADAAACDGLWPVPATPYADGEAAIAALRRARETGVPVLATCGGYQHALLEYARNVLGLTQAQHGEEHPEAELALIGRLACELVEVTGRIRLTPGSRLAAICGVDELE
ncbi:MAG: hypothetical protein E6K81_09940, partial [Candidatus Eisenbacteria bacterium]